MAEVADLRLEHPVAMGTADGCRCLRRHSNVLSLLPPSLCRHLPLALLLGSTEHRHEQQPAT